MIAARALGLLVASLVQRMLREPMVLRSLLFPIGISAGTLVAVLLGVTVVRAPPVVAFPPGHADPALVEALRWLDLGVVEAEDPAKMAETGWARVGVARGDCAADGRCAFTVFTRGPSPDAVRVEQLLRDRGGARWQMVADTRLPGAVAAQAFGARVARMLGGVFALYGVVVGAGLVARDRDEGTLGVEFASPIPRWMPGLARFFAATTVLGVFGGASLAVFHALVGVPGFAAASRHLVAASGASVAIGLLGMAAAGARGGFAAPLGFALTAAFAAFVSGNLVPSLAPFTPIASLYSDGSGYPPLIVALGAGLLAAWRLGRTELA